MLDEMKGYDVRTIPMSIRLRQDEPCLYNTAFNKQLCFSSFTNAYYLTPFSYRLLTTDYRLSYLNTTLLLDSGSAVKIPVPPLIFDMMVAGEANGLPLELLAS
jgi:hypothetical protein